MRNREQGNKGTRKQERVAQVSILRSWKAQRLASLAGLSAMLLVAGCRQDMHNQPKMFPQRGSDFFADHRGARPQVVNTVARGQLDLESYFNTGVIQGRGIRNNYTAAADGQKFLVMSPILGQNTSPLVGVLNWSVSLPKKQ